MFRDMHQATIGRMPFAYTDTLGNNVASRLIRCVDHFRAGILVLTVPASAILTTSPQDLRPFNTTLGYFIVNLDPVLQSIHLIWASSIASPRLVTRLNTFDDQF